jgi:hypothetical protein
VSQASRPPTGVLAAAGFFVAAGALQLVLEVAADPGGPSFGQAWGALGGASLHGLVGWGLWRRLAVCRTIALVYCAATLLTYGTALALALAGAPLRFPPSVVWQSIFQIPSCALLLPWLRTPAAAALFPRPLLGR